MFRLLAIAYLVVGVIMFEAHGGFSNIQTPDQAVNAFLTIVLWWIDPQVIVDFVDKIRIEGD